MACVIFDFDSTLIREESLEVLLAPQLAGQDDKLAALQAITHQGMNGELDFATSLGRRLAIAAPDRATVARYGLAARDKLTPGMPDLITDLRQRGVKVRIVSGGLREAILPVAHHLGLPDDAVHAVQLRWHGDGSFAGVDHEDAFSTGKVAGLRTRAPQWSPPRIVVGDGMTDAAIWQAGLADHFVAFTAHVRRHAVLATGAPEATNVTTLRNLLEAWL